MLTHPPPLSHSPFFPCSQQEEQDIQTVFRHCGLISTAQATASADIIVLVHGFLNCAYHHRSVLRPQADTWVAHALVHQHNRHVQILRDEQPKEQHSRQQFAGACTASKHSFGEYEQPANAYAGRKGRVKRHHSLLPTVLLGLRAASVLSPLAGLI